MVTPLISDAIKRYEERNKEHFRIGGNDKDWDAWCREMEKTEREGRSFSMAFYLGSAIVSLVTLNEIVRGPFQSAFISWNVDHAEEGKGIATEAVSHVLQSAREELHLHRIEANIRPENIRSRRLAEKLGFVYEGTSRNYLFVDGAWRDHEHWVMLFGNTFTEAERQK